MWGQPTNQRRQFFTFLAEPQSTMFTKHKQGDGGSKCEFSSNVSSSETCDVSAVVQA